MIPFSLERSFNDYPACLNENKLIGLLLVLRGKKKEKKKKENKKNTKFSALISENFYIKII